MEFPQSSFGTNALSGIYDLDFQYLSSSEGGPALPPGEMFVEETADFEAEDVEETDASFQYARQLIHCPRCKRPDAFARHLKDANDVPTYSCANDSMHFYHKNRSPGCGYIVSACWIQTLSHSLCAEPFTANELTTEENPEDGIYHDLDPAKRLVEDLHSTIVSLRKQLADANASRARLRVLLDTRQPTIIAPPAQSASTKPASPTPAPAPSRAYATAVKNSGIPEANVSKAADALRRLTSSAKRKPAPSTTAPSELKLLYLSGIRRKRISEVKSDLRELGLDSRSSSLANISFIGQSTCELLLSSSAHQSYSDLVTKLDVPSLRLLKDYDPTSAADTNATPELKATLREKFISRTSSIINRVGTLPAVSDFYVTLLKSMNIDPLVPPAPDEPMADASANDDPPLST